MRRIYRYILADDLGIAPCPAGGLISLATCKPTIRRKASPGDWVLGFRPGSSERGMLLWGGRVQEVVGHGDFERTHRGRPDALYRERKNGTFDRVDPEYHPAESEKVRDLSGPVLIFDPDASAYLNGHTIQLPVSLIHLAAAGRGHRVNGVSDKDLETLEGWFANVVMIKARQADRPASGRPKKKSC